MAQAYKLVGLKNLQVKLRQLPDLIKQDAINDIQDTADAIVLKAVQRVRVDLGPLSQSIGNEPKNGGLNYLIFVSAEYAPYVEWGTGTEVKVPSVLTNYASQFKGKGIKNINLPARPFFFNSYFEEREKLLIILKEHIAKHLK